MFPILGNRDSSGEIKNLILLMSVRNVRLDSSNISLGSGGRVVVPARNALNPQQERRKERSLFQLLTVVHQQSSLQQSLLS